MPAWPGPALFSGIDGPDRLKRRFEGGAAIAAAGLIGFGIILWIAANWDDLGKVGRFSLVGSAVAASGLIAAALPAARVAGALAAVLATGGLLALFGQTYQTGADAWQLFAGWAALTLPIALAARHDFVWALWTLVAFSALPLWAKAEAGWHLWEQTDVMLPVWLAAIALVAVVSPWLRLRRWIGKTRWTFRLAVVLTLFVVAGSVSASIFSSHPSAPIILTGSAIIAAGAALLVLVSPFDLALLAATTLTIDILLIFGFSRAVAWDHGGSEIGAMFLIGIAAAVIVAASGVAMLRLSRGKGAALPLSTGALPVAADPQDGSTWPIALVSGVGALFAAVPLLIFSFLALGPLIERGAGTYIVGASTLFGAVALVRSARPLSFWQQIAVIGMAVGGLLLGYAAFRDLPIVAAAILLAGLATVLGSLMPAGWMTGLFGVATIGFLAVAVTRIISADLYSDPGLQLTMLLLCVAASLAYLGLETTSRGHGAEQRQAWLLPFLVGAVAASLFGLVATAGPSFLLSHVVGDPTSVFGAPRDGAVAVEAVRRSLGGFCALGAIALMALRFKPLVSPVGIAVGVVLSAITSASPSLGPAVLALAVALIADRRALALLAAFAMLWIFGSFYYWLGWPLVHKAYLLVALGAGLAAVCLAAGRNRIALPIPAIGGMSVADGKAAPVLIGLGLLATALSVGTSIRGMEQLIATGTKVYVSLAPVDPRSLMQGDYMALRFALPREVEFQEPASAVVKPYAVIARDERGVGTVTRTSDKGATLSAGELLIGLYKRNGRWSLGPDGWFFKEGAAKTFEPARFGEFRVGGDGRAVLVGMADAQLQPLR